MYILCEHNYQYITAPTPGTFPVPKAEEIEALVRDTFVDTYIEDKEEDMEEEQLRRF